MAEQKTSEVQSSYDCAADAYARHLYDELQHKPADRELLNRFAARVDGGLVCDVGCGPGHVARYLHDRKVAVRGIDLSAGMIEQARRLNPEIEFTAGDLLALDVADGAFAGITGFYAIVNLPPRDLPQAFNEMHRVLQPGGWLLLSFHIGEETVHVDDLWGRAVSLDFYFFRTEKIVGFLRSAGFDVIETIERKPYAPEVEYQSQRAYIFARRPADLSTSGSKTL